MLCLTSLGGFGVGNAPLAKQLDFAGSSGISSSSGTSWSFPATPLGRPAANRHLIVAAFGSADLAGPDFNGCSVAGQAATLAVQESDRLIQSALYCLHQPFGWQATVTLSSNAVMSGGAGFFLLPVYGLASAAASDNASADTLFSTSRSAAVDCPAGGLIVSSVIETDETHGIGWSNLASELVDLQVGSARVGIAYEFMGSAQVGRSITASWTSAAIGALSVASWAAA